MRALVLILGLAQGVMAAPEIPAISATRDLPAEEPRYLARREYNSYTGMITAADKGEELTCEETSYLASRASAYARTYARLDRGPYVDDLVREGKLPPDQLDAELDRYVDSDAGRYQQGKVRAWVMGILSRATCRS